MTENLPHEPAPASGAPVGPTEAPDPGNGPESATGAQPATGPEPVWPAQPHHQQPWYGAPTQPPTQHLPAVPRSGGGAGKVVAAGLLGFLLAAGGGVVGGVIVHEADSGGRTPTAASTANKAPTSVNVMDRSSLADIAAAVKPSVVSIQVPGGEGSGVVFNTDGYIVTNNHVVAAARGDTVQVIFSDGKSASAKVVGTDPKTDLAVVRVTGVTGLVAAKFGDSNTLRVGDTVLAVGSPLGLDGSVTSGIVSALNRTISERGSDANPAQAQPQTTDIGGAIQTDAAINPGNSGGALVDLDAAVVGINTAIATSGQSEGNIGVGFAIPGNLAKRVAESLISGQKVSHPFLGVQVTTATGNAGATVSTISPGSPAEKAGLVAGDVITRAGTKDIHTSEDLVSVVQGSKVGDKLELSVTRNGKSTTVTVTIGESA
jgi:putative serine protease PepD